MEKLDVKILYVEDDFLTRELVKNYLENIAHEVYTAEDGRDGIEKFKIIRPEIVIVDLKMPEINGFTVKNLIKKIDKNIEIIAVSSTDDLHELEKVIDNEFDNFLLKPFSKEKLYSVISKSYDRIKDRIELDEYRENLEKMVQERTIRLSETNERLEKEINTRKIFEDKIIMLSKLVEQSSKSIIVISIEGKVKYVNKKYEEERNIKSEEIIDTVWNEYQEFLKKEDIWGELKKGRTWEGELFKKSGDSYCWYMISIYPIFNSVGEIIYFVSISEDITERKNIERELIEAKEKAETANKAKSQFLANMSHEIRTPMNGIFMMTDILITSELDDEQREIVSLLKSSTVSLLGIVNDILDFSKMEAGKLKLQNENFSIDKLINEIFESFKIMILKKNIDFRFFIKNEVPAKLKGDSERLTQVIMNILGNAVKFTEKGYIYLEVEKEEETKEETVLKFMVEDSGVGIPPQYLNVIFQDFVQVENSYTKKMKGTGLGLAISKNIIELMNGKIWVESTEGKGSKFYFTARFQNIDKNEEKNEDMFQFSSDESEFLNKSKILIAEDNETNRNLVKSLLKKKGFQIDIAVDGLETLKKWSKNEYDVILMDIQMPNMSGLEVTQKIREIEKLQDRRTNIIALTAFSAQHDLQNFINAGIDDYIIKPINFSELYSKILKYLKRNIFEERSEK